MNRSEFLWLGNWLAVDFINTEFFEDGRAVNRLPDASAFKRWLGEGHVPGADALLLEGPQRDQCWDLALAYRTLLRRGIAALAEGQPPPPDLLAKTNMLLADQDNAARLVERDGSFRLTAEPRFETPKTLMIPVARSFAELLVEADLDRLRKCRNPECQLYFHDGSKSGTRAWCSLERCGNKLRMAASRQRRSRQ